MIYFVQADIGGPIKIGYTTGMSADARVASLQVGCPWPLRVIHTMAGTARDEYRLHERFDHLRLHGEWFSADPDLLRWLGASAMGPQDPPRLVATMVRPPLHGPFTELDARILATLATSGGMRTTPLARMFGLSIQAMGGRLRSLCESWQAVDRYSVIHDGDWARAWRVATHLMVPSWSHHHSGMALERVV